MSNEVKLTASQQAAAIDNAHQSMSLRSGAGCGKTFVLARRYTELLLNYQGIENPLTRNVALTFTEKAAIEMNVRVRKMVRDFADKSEGEKRNRLLEYLDNLPEARISTIHSFCASVLRAHAIEADLDPAFSVCADNLLITQLRQKSAEKALLEDIESDSPYSKTVLEYINFNKTNHLLTKLLAQPEHWSQTDYQNPDQIIERWQINWQAARKTNLDKLQRHEKIISLIEQLESFSCDDPGDKLAFKRADFLDAIRTVFNNIEQASYDDASRIVGFKVGTVGSAKAWGSKEIVKTVRNLIKEIIALFEKYSIFFRQMGEIEKPAAEVLCSLIQLAAKASKIFKAEKRSRGILDFADLVVNTHRLLENNPEIRKQISSQIDQLLVDECQDTDAYQLSMLNLLFDENTTQTAFMVGDGKQSIYRFRGADVNVYESLCRQLGKGKTETLDVSFRTHEGSVEFINELFSPLILDYEPTKAFRKTFRDDESVEFLFADSNDPITSAAQAEELQAQITAQRIKQMIDNGEKLVEDRKTASARAVRPGDIAILFSRMTKALSYEKHLQRLGVPYYVVGGSGFFQQQEIYDLINILQVIDNPFNDIALIGVLRSSLFGLDDNALMLISEKLKGGPYFEKLQNATFEGILDNSQLETLTDAISLIAEHSNIKNAIGTAEILQRIIDKTGYTSVLISQFNGKRMVANVKQLIKLARNADSECVTLADFITQVDTLTVSEERYEQAVVSGEAEDVVRLMTVHKSKGLEFPVVFLPDLNHENGKCKEYDLLYRDKWKLTLNLTWPIDRQQENSDEKPLPFEASKCEENIELTDEHIRRLYVAATRHEDYLVFVAANWRNKKGRLSRNGSFISMLDEQLNLSDTIDEEKEAILYAGGKYQAAIRKMQAEDTPTATEPNKLANEILKHSTTPDQLAQSILATAASADSAPPLAGIISEHIGTIETAVTAMGDFEHCPKLFQWRYELRTPTEGLIETADKKNQSNQIDAATLGTLLHRCMELLNFKEPQPADVLVSQVCHEMDLDDIADKPNLTLLLEEMLERFQKHPLWESLQNAQAIYPELDFVLNLPQVTLKGQIDLLYKDSQGKWRVIDYKSDRVEEKHIDEHSKRYELQMLTYALAVAQQDEMQPEDVSLYFLRAGEVFKYEINADILTQATDRIENLVKKIIHARRTGNYEQKTGEYCQRCPYQKLC